MPSRLAIYRTRREYAQALGFDVSDYQRSVGGDLIRSYNYAPGRFTYIQHQFGNGRESMDSDRWGYQSPERLRDAPVTSIPVEVAPRARFFRHMWAAGRAILPIDGWFEWTWQDGQQPWFVQLRTDEPMLIAILTNFRPYQPRREGSGFVLLEAPDGRGAVNPEERRPLVLMPADARRWIDPETSPQDAEAIALSRGRVLRHFAWYRVSLDVNDQAINEPYLIEPA